MADADALIAVLEQARAAGFLGPGPVEPHIHHAEGFAVAAEAALGRIPGEFADLGTGGGVPGLVLADRWVEARGIFVETGQRRCAWLREAIGRLGLQGRIEVLEGRAEVVGQSESREGFEVVTARSFAGPAVTAEIGAGLLAVGGILVVSEPPEPDDSRWPAEALRELGFEAAERVAAGGAHFSVVRKAWRTPERYPRGAGKPAKRPLW